MRFAQRGSRGAKREAASAEQSSLIAFAAWSPASRARDSLAPLSLLLARLVAMPPLSHAAPSAAIVATTPPSRRTCARSMRACWAGLGCNWRCSAFGWSCARVFVLTGWCCPFAVGSTAQEGMQESEMSLALEKVRHFVVAVAENDGAFGELALQRLHGRGEENGLANGANLRGAECGHRRRSPRDDAQLARSGRGWRA